MLLPCPSAPTVYIQLLAFRVHSPPVITEIAARFEGLLAKNTPERPLARVHPHMVATLVARRKRSVAHGARESPLAHVNSTNVPGEIPLLREGLFAETALERPLAVVHPLVIDEVARIPEPLAAHITFVPIGRLFPLHANMHMSHVVLEMACPRESLQANCARERLLARVRPPVVDEIGLPPEPLAA